MAWTPTISPRGILIGIHNLGYAAAATLEIPIWSWGATQSKVKQAELNRDRTKVEASFTQRQLVGEFTVFLSRSGHFARPTRIAAAVVRSGQREPETYHIALPGGRSHRAGSSGCTEHAHPDARCLRRRAGALSRRAGRTANPYGAFLNHADQSLCGCGFAAIAILLVALSRMFASRRKKPSRWSTCRWRP